MRIWLALCLGLAMAGCAGGSNKIDAIYQLEAVAAPPVSSSSSAQILVPEPDALAALATEKVAVAPSALTLSYYPNVALQDTAPKVLQRILLDTFQNTGQVQAVGLPGQSLLINYQVVTEVRAFQAEPYANRARVEVAVKLLNDSNGRVLRNRIFTTTVPLVGSEAEDAAEALNLASQQLAVDVVNWTLTSI